MSINRTFTVVWIEKLQLLALCHNQNTDLLDMLFNFYKLIIINISNNCTHYITNNSIKRNTRFFGFNQALHFPFKSQGY